MGMCACATGMMTCTFGAAPSNLMVLPTNKVLTCSKPAATIMDNKPMVNILPFGVCNAPSNPTNWKGPVFTPGPCVPNTVAPWAPGSPTVLIGNMPALNDSSKLMCIWAGMISFSMAGQFTVQVP